MYMFSRNKPLLNGIRPQERAAAQHHGVALQALTPFADPRGFNGSQAGMAQLSAVAIHPHRRRAADSDRHNRQIEQRNHSKQADQRAELHIIGFMLTQRAAHFLKADLMVVEWVVAILNGEHPGAEQEPQHRRHRLPEAGNKVKQQQTGRPWQIPSQFCHSRFIMRGISFITASQPLSGNGWPVSLPSSCSASRPQKGRRSSWRWWKEIAEHQHNRDDRQRPEQIAEPLKPVRHVRHQLRDPVIKAAKEPDKRAAEQHNINQQRNNDEAANARQTDQFPALRKVMNAVIRSGERVTIDSFSPLLVRRAIIT